MKPLGLFIKQDISLNEDLYNLVAGKRVTIVAPGAYLLGSDRGKVIDEYDVVIRPNEIVPPKEVRCDYGNRTDIMFCNFGTPWMPGIKRKIERSDNKEHFSNLKLVVATSIKSDHSELDYMSWPNDYVSNVVKNFNDVNEFNLPFYWIGVKDYKTLFSKVGVEFNTGMAAIMILLYYPIKELFVSGFTFYMGGDKYEDLYYKGHMDEIDTKGKAFGFNAGHGAHANIKQIEYFKQLYNMKKGLLKTDDEMKNMLSL
tara:strand:- start:263 stop:1030 length:768 start_codon:yes stop_codon:yes gene_type:complete